MTEAQEQAIRNQHCQQLHKITSILHSSSAPVEGRDTAADQAVRSTDALLATLEQRVLRTLPNGIQVIGVFDRGVQVNEYHGKL